MARPTGSGIKVVPHLDGEIELVGGRHRVVVEPDPKKKKLPPLQPPDAYKVRPEEPTRIKVAGRRLDLSDHEELIAEVEAAGSELEFHLLDE